MLFFGMKFDSSFYLFLGTSSLSACYYRNIVTNRISSVDTLIVNSVFCFNSFGDDDNLLKNGSLDPSARLYIALPDMIVNYSVLTFEIVLCARNSVFYGQTERKKLHSSGPETRTKDT